VVVYMSGMLPALHFTVMGRFERIIPAVNLQWFLNQSRSRRRPSDCGSVAGRRRPVLMSRAGTPRRAACVST
jgi:hypothetical protein